MSAPAQENQRSRVKHHSVPGRSKPTTGKGRLSLERYKAQQRAALDQFRKQCGG